VIEVACTAADAVKNSETWAWQSAFSKLSKSGRVSLILQASVCKLNQAGKMGAVV
jgi:hypothetical protein